MLFLKSFLRWLDTTDFGRAFPTLSMRIKKEEANRSVHNDGVWCLAVRWKNGKGRTKSNSPWATPRSTSYKKTTDSLPYGDALESRLKVKIIKPRLKRRVLANVWSIRLSVLRPGCIKKKNKTINMTLQNKQENYLIFNVVDIYLEILSIRFWYTN